MSNASKWWGVWIAVGCAGLPMIASAQPTTAPAADNDTEAQIRELRQEVRDLRDQLNATRVDSARATTQPYSRDANAAIENNLQQNPGMGNPNEELVGINSGWDPDKGFVIRSEDGSFLMHPWAFMQFRNATRYVTRSPGDGYDTQNGWELPRAKFIIDGNAYSKDLTYQFIWATSDSTGNLGLQDAWGRYHIPDSPWAVEAGQIRDPVDHEQIVFATKSLTPDRSIVNNVLLNGDDIVKGVEVSYGYDDHAAQWRAEGAITSGERNFDTTFEDYPTNNADWGAAGRVEWKYEGKWKDYKQFTALGDTEPLLVFGAGADYTEAGEAAQFTHVADVQYDTPAGTAVYAAYLGRYTRGDAGPPTTNGQVTATSNGKYDTYDPTFRLMAAQLITTRLEPFARYEYIHFDSRELPANTNGTVNDFTLGFNYYFYGHRAKLTTALSYLPNGSPISASIGDLLATHGGQEIIAQVQFQLIL